MPEPTETASDSPPQGWVKFCMNKIEALEEAIVERDFEGAEVQLGQLKIGLNGVQHATEKMLLDLVAREEREG